MVECVPHLAQTETKRSGYIKHISIIYFVLTKISCFIFLSTVWKLYSVSRILDMSVSQYSARTLVGRPRSRILISCRAKKCFSLSQGIDCFWNTPPFIQWMFSQRWSGRSVKLTGNHHLAPRLKSGALPVFLHVSSRRGQWLHFQSITSNTLPDDDESYVKRQLFEKLWFTVVYTCYVTDTSRTPITSFWFYIDSPYKL